MNKEITFIHLRNRDGDGKVLSKGGVTLAIRKESVEGDQYHVGVACCNNKDNFDKRIGRAKAGGRTKAVKGNYWTVIRCENIKQVVKDAIKFAGSFKELTERRLLNA